MKINAFSTIEVILGMAIFAVISVTLVPVMLYATNALSSSSSNTRAIFLAQEGLEAVRSIRQGDGYSTLTNGTFGLSLNASQQWQLQPAAVTTDGYTRSIVISSPNATTKKVDSVVTWTKNGANRTTSFTTYFKDIYRTIQVIVPWQNPAPENQINTAANNALKIDYANNMAYVVFSSGSYRFAIFDLTNLAAPALRGNVNLSSQPTNIRVSGNYAYISATSNSREIEVYNINNPNSPSFVTSINLPGNANTLSLDIQGDLMVVGRSSSGSSNEVQFISIANPNSPSLLGSVNISANVTDIRINGGYTYVSTTNSSAELIVINNFFSIFPFIQNSINLSGSSVGQTLSYKNDRLVVGRGNGELIFFNVSNTSSPVQVSTFNADSQVNDTKFSDDGSLLFIGQSGGSSNFKIIDLSNFTTPTLRGSRSTSDSFFGISYDSSRDRAYLVGSNNSSEIQIFKPQ